MKILLSTLNLLCACYLWGGSLWSPPHLLLNDCEDKKNFSLSINSEGEAIIGWVNQAEGKIEIAEYTFMSDKLQKPKVVYPCGFNTTLMKLILAENKRDIFAMWLDEDAECIKISRYSTKTGVWSKAICLFEAGSIQDPILSLDVHGNAMVVWNKFTGFEHQIQSLYFSVQENKWHPLTTLSPIGYDCLCQKFSFDSEGNAVAVWKADLFTSSNSGKGIQAVRFDAITGQWSPSLFFSDFMDSFIPVNLDMTFDVDDNLIIIWYSKDRATQTDSFQFISYNAAEETWGNKTLIETREKEIFYPQLVNNRQGIYAIWQTSDDLQEQLKSLLLNYPGSYLADEIVIPSSLGKITTLKIKADHFGKIILLSTDERQIQISELEDSWENSALFEEEFQATHLQVEGDALGNALIIWEKENQLFYSRGDYLLPPTEFAVRVVEKKFVAKTSLRALLTWHEAKSPSARRYKIRKNEEVIADIPAYQTQFLDKMFHKGQSVYTICSINEKNLESQLTEVIIKH